MKIRPAWFFASRVDGTKTGGDTKLAVALVDKIIFIAIVYLIDNKKIRRSAYEYHIRFFKDVEVMCHTWIDDCLTVYLIAFFFNDMEF